MLEWILAVHFDNTRNSHFVSPVISHWNSLCVYLPPTITLSSTYICTHNIDTNCAVRLFPDSEAKTKLRQKNCERQQPELAN